MSEFLKLSKLCTQQGTVLDAIVARGEANPELVDTPEMQAEIRRELEYASYLISTTSKELCDSLGETND